MRTPSPAWLGSTILARRLLRVRFDGPDSLNKHIQWLPDVERIDIDRQGVDNLEHPGIHPPGGVASEVLLGHYKRLHANELQGQILSGAAPHNCPDRGAFSKSWDVVLVNIYAHMHAVHLT